MFLDFDKGKNLAGNNAKRPQAALRYRVRPLHVNLECTEDRWVRAPPLDLSSQAAFGRQAGHQADWMKEGTRQTDERCNGASKPTI